MSSSGDKLASLMRERNVSKNRLAKMTGLSKATVRRMCTGDMTGTFDSWCRVLSALDADANEFVRSMEDDRSKRG